VISTLGALALLLLTPAQIRRFPACYCTQEVQTNDTTIIGSQLL
jgi:hypothetical protein